MKKLSSEIVIFYFFKNKISSIHFKYASEQRLLKTLIVSRFQGMYWCAHETTTLTAIKHTVQEEEGSKIDSKIDEA